MNQVSAEGARNTFVADVQEIRRRANDHMAMGAMTRGYRSERETVIRILNEVLATELVCMQRYQRHSTKATGIHKLAVAREFLERASEEQEHADIAVERILNLGGEPNFHPIGLTSISPTPKGENLPLFDMVQEDLIAEQIAVELYRDIIRYLGDNDPTTRLAMEQIMAKEEEHAGGLARLLEVLSVGEGLATRS
ncbi:MAG: ferritin-like domain-containing protein [Acidobacteriota bacterium]